MAEIITLDDVKDAAVLIGKILRKSGHTVHAFTEEEDAITHVELHKTDLAILDIKLKRMNGVEVLAILKKIDPSIRIIMLTGYPTAETAKEAISLGADEYCIKPIDRYKLEEKVTKVLNLSK